MVIRPTAAGDEAALARVHVDTWRHTYAGVVSADYLAGLSYERSRRGWETFLARDKVRVLVAEDPAAGVVGFVSAGPNTESGAGINDETSYEANLSAIYVLPDHQCRGVGFALMTAIIGRLVTEGYRSMLVWVLKGNRACGFYERLGGVPAGQRKQAIGGVEMAVVAYGWPDLARHASLSEATTP